MQTRIGNCNLCIHTYNSIQVYDYMHTCTDKQACSMLSPDLASVPAGLTCIGRVIWMKYKDIMYVNRQ